jgi:hypothetical protein
VAEGFFSGEGEEEGERRNAHERVAGQAIEVAALDKFVHLREEGRVLLLFFILVLL